MWNAGLGASFGVKPWEMHMLTVGEIESMLAVLTDDEEEGGDDGW